MSDSIKVHGLALDTLYSELMEMLHDTAKNPTDEEINALVSRIDSALALSNEDMTVAESMTGAPSKKRKKN